LEKLAERIEGDTMMSFFEHLSTRAFAATLTTTEREREDTRTAGAARENLSAIVRCCGLARR
jgi:hypothetical protein